MTESSKGIDVRLALEILSQRSGEDTGTEPTTRQTAACGCVHHASDETRSLGQIIDLNPQESAEQDILRVEQENLDEEREKRRSHLQSKVESMDVRDLLMAVLEAQQQRVQTYQKYNAGLDSLLYTRNLSTYPQICAEATAHFAVVSDTITCIHRSLYCNHQRPDLADLVQNLQRYEKHKLNFSAALHLERIRENQGGEERILVLIRQSIRSLETKISSCVEAVNDLIEEIQCTLVDE